MFVYSISENLSLCIPSACLLVHNSDALGKFLSGSNSVLLFVLGVVKVSPSTSKAGVVKDIAIEDTWWLSGNENYEIVLYNLLFNRLSFVCFVVVTRMDIFFLFSLFYSFVVYYHT